MATSLPKLGNGKRDPSRCLPTQLPSAHCQFLRAVGQNQHVFPDTEIRSCHPTWDSDPPPPRTAAARKPGPSAMFYLAAAVSDFYVPVSEMPEHKIQSSGGPLQITMKMVPKMLSPLVKDWAPKAFIISFKLETNPSILIDRARNALEVYRHQVVVANILESRRSFVVIITKGSETKLLLSEEEIEKGIEIEEKIVDDLQSRHTAFIQDNN
ncbi:phosphopantothenate--cysteine ligase isoform X2 [Pteronotus mesoamericanus]|uniref:phosphopantothenate--cysteine ligase isoform X2 n=1 Tax=Pteronotus mesoamericanus TaxID=1884717 RepID=UPI0023ECE221|nr:phosphopantothenate--cysteine ligase isoform X2 [Pteronotus parnellii mesoamericanus]